MRSRVISLLDSILSDHVQPVELPPTGRRYTDSDTSVFVQFAVEELVNFSSK